MRIKIFLCFVIALLNSIAVAQTVPKEIWGRWTIRRELPTTTISCWGEADARKIIGTELEYSDRVFRWSTITKNDPVVETRTITAKQFHDENSGGSVNSSQVTLQQLGIKGSRATQIIIRHDDAHVSAATNEIPGDNVLVKSADTIVLSVCSIYFEAKRVPDKK